MTGTIFAVHYNDLGVFGMAGGSELCLLVPRVLSNDGSAFMSTILEGIQWAVNEGAKVRTMMVGGQKKRRSAILQSTCYAHASHSLTIALFL